MTLGVGVSSAREHRRTNRTHLAMSGRPEIVSGMACVDEDALVTNSIDSDGLDAP